MSPRWSTRLLAKQTDARLIELCRHGNERAFEAVVLRYGRELLSYCRQLGLPDSRAEDALQHALLKAWLALENGTEVRDLRAWLRRIAHNTTLNIVRNSHDSRTVDLDSPFVDGVDLADGAVERTNAVRDALGRVAALPAMQREAMLLSAVEGRSHEEVASALGVSHVAVRGLLYRARSTLRAGAAALTPAPLVGWITQVGGRLAATASSSSEWAGGGFGLGKMFLEGAAVAATAAVAVGAVFGSSHPDRHRGTRAPRSVASVDFPTAGAARGAVTPRPHGRASSPGIPAGASGHGRLGGKMIGGSPHAGQRPASEVSAPIAAPPGQLPQAGGVTDSAASNAATGSGTASPGESSSGASREAPQPPTAPKPSEPPQVERKPEDGGSTSESAEREAEAARELREREAEAARERSEREAEAARELREREAEAARELREREAGH
jgi:RNA polymerase sigma factor (sigma-70 family)